MSLSLCTQTLIHSQALVGCHLKVYQITDTDKGNVISLSHNEAATGTTYCTEHQVGKTLTAIKSGFAFHLLHLQGTASCYVLCVLMDFLYTF